jgi:hypothetical protein
MYPAFSPHFPDLKPMDFAMFDHLKDQSFKLQELDELQKETTRRCHNIDLRNNFCFFGNMYIFVIFLKKYGSIAETKFVVWRLGFDQLRVFFSFEMTLSGSPLHLGNQIITSIS